MIGCQNDNAVQSVIEKKETVVPEYLPANILSLSDLSSFKPSDSNWSVQGGVKSDFSKEWNLESITGAGVLVNNVKDIGVRDAAGEGSHLFTNLVHGDMELELDVLVAKNSNSGLYFQSRYELQIRDSAADDDVSSDDMGGIYAQSSEAKGSAPSLNAARAAGLWQHYKVLFRAPTFDAQGNKMSNAKFEYVYLNGYLIQENVEVAGPTIEAAFNDEVDMAPLMIQGDHGPVAFKNIKYKTFNKDQVQLSSLHYKLYDGKFDYIPDFTQLEVVKEGDVTDFKDLREIAGKNDGYSIVFEGDLTIPTDGEYLFESSIDDGGNTYINDQLVVHNQGEPGGGTERGSISLTKGLHKLRQSYYQEVWGANLSLNIEGPNIEKAPLPSLKEEKIVPDWAVRKDHKIVVEDEPVFIRGFVDHHDVKKTHILSVGTPQGIHYSYDTRHNQLINLWKGAFADVSRMWNGRGASQRLDPISAELGLESRPHSDDCRPLGFSVDDSGLPVFNYRCGDVIIYDRISPSSSNTSAIRRISVENGNYNYVIGSGERIDALSDGWYSIGNQYYVKAVSANPKWQIGDSEITTQVSSSEELVFEIYW